MIAGSTANMDITHSDELIYFLNHMDLELLENGYAVLDSRWAHRGVCSPYSRLYYILSGEGVLEDTEGRTYSMTPGNLYLVPSGMTFHYHCPVRLEKIFFHFTLRGADRYDILSRCRSFLTVPCREAVDGSLLRLFRQAAGNTGAAALGAILWRDIASLIAAMPEPPAPGKVYSPLVRRAISYIRAHLSNHLRTAEIASSLFVSPSCLSSHFRREVGVGIGRYTDDMVAFRARELLLRDDLSIGEISLRLGFCDQFYFARKFRQIHGETPNSFRRRQHNLF